MNQMLLFAMLICTVLTVTASPVSINKTEKPESNSRETEIPEPTKQPSSNSRQTEKPESITN